MDWVGLGESDKRLDFGKWVRLFSYYRRDDPNFHKNTKKPLGRVPQVASER